MGKKCKYKYIMLVKAVQLTWFMLSIRSSRGAVSHVWVTSSGGGGRRPSYVTSSTTATSGSVSRWRRGRRPPPAPASTGWCATSETRWRSHATSGRDCPTRSVPGSPLPSWTSTTAGTATRRRGERGAG